MNEITFNIWSVLILLGAIQGLFLSIYIFTQKRNLSFTKWLGLLVIVISLHLFEYAADISGLVLVYPVFIGITYPLLFCMGPFYYFYCRALTDSYYKINFKSFLNFIPALVVLLMMLPFYIMADELKVQFIENISQNGVIKIPAEQLIFMGAHVIQTSIYIFVSYKFIYKKENEVKKFSSDSIVIKNLEWLKKFSLCFSIYFLLYLILVLILVFIDSYQFEIDYSMLLIMAASIYVLSYISLTHFDLFRNIETAESQKNEKIKSKDKFPGLKEKLLEYMKSEKPYLKNDLKISDLASGLSVPAYQLSQLINDEFSVNFYDFINKYRIEDAKNLLVDETYNYKILAIAYEVGFNSKATFNRVFKKITSFTPSEYKEKHSSGASGQKEILSS